MRSLALALALLSIGISGSAFAKETSFDTFDGPNGSIPDFWDDLSKVGTASIASVGGRSAFLLIGTDGVHVEGTKIATSNYLVLRIDVYFQRDGEMAFTAVALEDSATCCDPRGTALFGFDRATREGLETGQWHSIELGRDFVSGRQWVWHCGKVAADGTPAPGASDYSHLTLAAGPGWEVAYDALEWLSTDDRSVFDGALRSNRPCNTSAGPTGETARDNVAFGDPECLDCDSVAICDGSTDPTCPPTLSAEWTAQLPVEGSRGAVLDISVAGPGPFDLTLYLQLDGDIGGATNAGEFARATSITTGEYIYKIQVNMPRTSVDLGVRVRDPSNGSERIYYLGHIRTAEHAASTSLTPPTAPPTSAATNVPFPSVTTATPANPQSPAETTPPSPTLTGPTEVRVPGLATVVLLGMLSLVATLRFRRR